MVTIYKGRKYDVFNFKELEIGQTFIEEPTRVTLTGSAYNTEFAEGTSLYMKTNNVGECNCIDLNTGRMCYMSNNVGVILVDAQVHWDFKQGE